MKCSQCDRPGRYKYQDGSMLCLDCHGREQDIIYRRDELEFRRELLNAAHINKAELDIAATVGMPVYAHELIPVAAIAAAAAKGTKMTNITITGSQVGVINTGDLAKIEAAVEISKGSDAEQLGEAMKALTVAVIDSKDLTADTKKEVGQLLAALTGQIAGTRSKPVAMQLLKGVEERTKGVNAVWDLVVKVGGLVGLLLAGS